MKAQAWALFDRIVRDAAPSGVYSNPWLRQSAGEVVYEPDFETLKRLLAVPLLLKAPTTTGVPALALDVWIAYELRRAGFAEDAVWPRAVAPRILPTQVARLVKGVPAREGDALRERLRTSPPKDVVSASANVLGKNYIKQVDVVMADWSTGPEVLVSTKRMDSSFGKNAANRVEESYGDAKNLRLRYPLAALGFVYGMRSTVLTKEPKTARWLVDLLQKLGREEDAYDAVMLLLIEYDDAVAVHEEADSPDGGENALAAAGVHPEDDATDAEGPDVELTELERQILNLPDVRLRLHEVPRALKPATFLATMVERVLSVTPVPLHDSARERRSDPRRAADAVASPHLDLLD